MFLCSPFQIFIDISRKEDDARHFGIIEQVLQLGRLEHFHAIVKRHVVVKQVQPKPLLVAIFDLRDGLLTV